LQQGNYRNFILSVSLRMSILSVSVSSATFFTSMYGMNLANGLPPNSPLAFAGVSVLSVVFGVAAFRWVDRLTLKNSPTLKHSRRLATFQDFLLKLDSKMDAAKSTLAAASAGAGRNAATVGSGADAGNGSIRASDGFERLFSNEYSAASGTAPSTAGSVGAAVQAMASTLSKAEFAAWHGRTTGVTLPEDELDLLFELLDVDGDGRLRPQEVLGLFQSSASSGSYQAAAAGGLPP